MRHLLVIACLTAIAAAQTVAGGMQAGGMTGRPPHSVDLSWTDSDEGITFRIYRGTSSHGESLLASGINALTFTDLNVVSGTTYYYKVTAVRTSDGLESGYSNETSAAIPAN